MSLHQVTVAWCNCVCACVYVLDRSRRSNSQARAEKSTNRPADGQAQVQEESSATPRIRQSLWCHRDERAGRLWDQQVRKDRACTKQTRCKNVEIILWFSYFVVFSCLYFWAVWFMLWWVSPFKWVGPTVTRACSWFTCTQSLLRWHKLTAKTETNKEVVQLQSNSLKLLVTQAERKKNPSRLYFWNCCVDNLISETWWFNNIRAGIWRIKSFSVADVFGYYFCFFQSSRTEDAAFR